jgi:hypothetical protein
VRVAVHELLYHLQLVKMTHSNKYRCSISAATTLAEEQELLTSTNEYFQQVLLKIHYHRAVAHCLV